ncbi:hypothetical protein ACQ4M3_19015 [Leptolyngbya sp. AN03gr2]|uniref:hypothetical protein n=1 Tax=Leptolyngbya sp. AN03gr2 TaxID=3423364 RepID=UPI003D3167AA
MRIYATDRQILISILSGIHSHPLIQNPSVYYPLVNKNDKPRQVRIEKYRTYAGRELLESGLTLSVFYRYKNRAAFEFTPYTLGQTEAGQHLDKGLARIILQLSIQDTRFDQPTSVGYDQLLNYQDSSAHGRQISASINPNQTILSEELGGFAERREFKIYISPAEELLREYTSLLRAVLRDQQTFRPYVQRNLSIKAVEYLTPEIFESAPENLVFHKSQIHIELDVFEPPTARALEFLPPIETVNIE